MRSRPTLADVAHEAGVSKTAVSLVLNEKGMSNVSETTRQRILSAARSLGFRPHGVARALSRRRADVLGVVGKTNPFVHESQHLFEHGLLSAIFRRTLECGYNPLIYGYPAEPDDDHNFARYADGRSDAFLFLNPPTDCALLGYLHSRGIPVVTICCRDGDPRGRWVDSDNEAGISAIVNHLADLGHERIAYFVGPSDEDNARTRTEAFRAALTARGLPVRDDWTIRFNWQIEETTKVMDQMMAQTTAPTGVLAWNDYAAEILCTIAVGLGLRVPQDLSIAGFDDTPSARMSSPPLTTVRQDLALLGRSAVDLALAALSDDSAGSRRSALCPVDLIVRNSTAAVP